MKTIIFGKIGSGKSTIARQIATDRHIPYENVDDYVAQWYKEPNHIAWLERTYHVRTKEEMRNVIVSQPEVLSILSERMSHYVAERIQHYMTNHENCILEFPHLNDYPMYRSYADEIICVYAPEDIRLQRVLQRDHGTTPERFHVINQKQGPDETYDTWATHRIVNDGSWDIKEWERHLTKKEILTLSL